MSESNGVSNYDVMREVSALRNDTEDRFTALEEATKSGSAAIVEELKTHRGLFIKALLSVIKTLCLCLFLTVAWLSGIKAAPEIVNKIVEAAQ